MYGGHVVNLSGPMRNAAKNFHACSLLFVARIAKCRHVFCVPSCLSLSTHKLTYTFRGMCVLCMYANLLFFRHRRSWGLKQGNKEAAVQNGSQEGTSLFPQILCYSAKLCSGLRLAYLSCFNPAACGHKWNWNLIRSWKGPNE